MKERAIKDWTIPRWVWPLLAVLLLLSGVLYAQSTTEIVTATIRDVAGNLVTSGQITFELKPATSTVIAGYARFVPETVSCSINQASTLSLARASNVVTATFTQPMTFEVGSVFQAAGWSDATFDGTFTILSVPDNLHATWAQTAANSTATGGWISELQSNPGPGSCTLTQNTALTPAGTYYQVCLWPYGSKTACFNYYALTNTVDLSTVVPAPNQLPSCSGCATSTQPAGFCANANVSSGEACLGPPPGQSGLLQSNAGDWVYGSGSSWTETLPFPGQVTAGQAILVVETNTQACSFPNGSNPPPAGTITDTQGDAFTFVTGSNTGGEGNLGGDAQAFVGTISFTGSDTISAKYTCPNHGLFIATFSGLGAFDAIGGGGSNFGQQGIWQATINTIHTDVLIGVGGVNSSASDMTNVLSDDTWALLPPGVITETGDANPSQFYAVQKYAPTGGAYTVSFSSHDTAPCLSCGANVYLFAFQASTPVLNGTPGFRILLPSDLPPQEQLQSGRTAATLGGPDLDPPSAPTVGAPTSGGSLGATLQATVEVTYVNAKGETTPTASNETSPTSGTCPGSGSCEMVVTSPAASGDAVSYNVYANTCAAAPCTGLTKQNASPITLGTNFTWTTLVAGIAPPSTNTSGQLSNGAPTAAGICDTTTVNVTGAIAGEHFGVTPEGYPGAGFVWSAYPSATLSVVNVQVCAVGTGTPTAEFYDVRVIP